MSTVSFCHTFSTHTAFSSTVVLNPSKLYCAKIYWRQFGSIFCLHGCEKLRWMCCFSVGVSATDIYFSRPVRTETIDCVIVNCLDKFDFNWSKLDSLYCSHKGKKWSKGIAVIDQIFAWRTMTVETPTCVLCCTCAKESFASMLAIVVTSRPVHHISQWLNLLHFSNGCGKMVISVLSVYSSNHKCCYIYWRWLMELVDISHVPVVIS